MNLPAVCDIRDIQCRETQEQASGGAPRRNSKPVEIPHAVSFPSCSCSSSNPSEKKKAGKSNTLSQNTGDCFANALRLRVKCRASPSHPTHLFVIHCFAMKKGAPPLGMAKRWMAERGKTEERSGLLHGLLGFGRWYKSTMAKPPAGLSTGCCYGTMAMR